MTKGLHKDSLRKVDNPHQWMIDDARMELIQQIKAEVERLKEENNNIRCESNKAYCQGYGDAFVDLLSVLSDLESEKPTIQEQTVCEDVEKEEKPMNPDELEKAVVDYFEGYWPGMETAEQCNTDLRFTPPAIMRLARHFYELGCRRTAEKYDEIEYKRQRADVCEGLEEEIRSYFMTNRIVNHSEMGWKRWGEQIARHFAQWGAEHATHAETTNDLEEAAKDYRETKIANGHFFKIKGNKPLCYLDDLTPAFIAGAKWQKEQMMKEAVEIEWKSGTMKKDGKEVPFDGGKAKIIIVALED